jgi:hypothetical protein
MRRTPLAGLVVAAALALAACGGDDGSSGEKEEIETVILTYFTAFADGDGAKACGQLATDTQVELVKATRATNCPEAMAEAAKQPEIQPYVERFRDAEVVEVEITGSTAKAKVRAIGEETTIPLATEDGEWKIRGGQVAPGG